MLKAGRQFAASRSTVRAEPIAGDDDVEREVGADDGGGGGAERGDEAGGDAALGEGMGNTHDQTAVIAPADERRRAEPGVEVGAPDGTVRRDLFEDRRPNLPTRQPTLGDHE